MMNQCDACRRHIPKLGMDHTGPYRNPSNNVPHFHRIAPGLDGVIECLNNFTDKLQ